MGAAGPGSAGDRTVGEWEGPRAPSRARAWGQGQGVSVRPLGVLAGAQLHHSFRGRGARTLAGLRLLGHNPEIAGPAASTLRPPPELPGIWGRGRLPAVTQRTGPRGYARAPKGRGLAWTQGLRGGCAMSCSLFP